MRISDWSSDVCSSDLVARGAALGRHHLQKAVDRRRVRHAPALRRRSSAPPPPVRRRAARGRSEEHTSELQSLMRSSYAVFCLKKKKNQNSTTMQSNLNVIINIHHNYKYKCAHA